MLRMFSAYGDDSVRYALSIGVSLSVVGGIAYLSGSTKYARAIAQSEEGLTRRAPEVRCFSK